MNKTRTIIIDGIEIQTSLSALEIADLEQKNKELIQKIKFNEKSRRKMQQSLMKQIDTLEQQCKKQKEVIDNVINIINQHFKHHPELLTENQIEYELIRKIENILKEVSE